MFEIFITVGSMELLFRKSVSLNIHKKWISSSSVGACVMPWDFLVNLWHHTSKFSEDYVESEKTGVNFSF